MDVFFPSPCGEVLPEAPRREKAPRILRLISRWYSRRWYCRDSAFHLACVHSLSNDLYGKSSVPFCFRGESFFRFGEVRPLLLLPLLDFRAEPFFEPTLVVELSRREGLREGPQSPVTIGADGHLRFG